MSFKLSETFKEVCHIFLCCEVIREDVDSDVDEIPFQSFCIHRKIIVLIEY